MRLRSVTLRHWVVAAFGAVGIGLLPWTVWLGSSLQAQHVTNNWDVAWSGFDTGLALLCVATAVAAYRRSTWVGALAAAVGTVLVVDAWFDVVLDSHWAERRYSILLAVLAELPAAAACFWIARRTERFLEWIVAETELDVAPTGEGAAEGDLVGVLEIPTDGETASKPRHPHPPA